VTRDELIARLAQLDASDRRWLLGELPPALRRELAQVLTDEAPAAAITATAATPPMRPDGWESLDAERVAALLDTEPVWLVSAALRGTDARWRERVLAAMTPRRRHELDMADRTGRPLGARAVHLLLAACRARVAGAPPRTPTRTGFAALVDQMRGRFA
jgi:Mg/Co/Ni transporter MgtE